MESDHAKIIWDAAEALDKENVEVDLDGLINYISQLFDFIEEKEEGNNPSMPKAATDDWPVSKRLLKLKERLWEGFVNLSEGFKDVCPDAKKIAQDFLRGMGSAHMATTGLLAVANILEQYEKITDNKKACLSLLKEMNKLAVHVKELQKQPALNKGMEASMREAIVLIVETSMACCTQIRSSKFSGFFSNTVDRVMLDKFQNQLCVNQINMSRQKRGQLPYPQYPKDAVGIEEPLKEVITRLEMGRDKNAVAVILHGFGGMGKTTLADAVFAQLFDANREGYKYSYVRLFDTIASVPDVVKLQRCILTDLMMGEESEIPEIRRYEEGQQVIEDMLEKEAAFIYIDNVLLPDKVEQGRDALHHLLPKNMRNARKLRLLLTTRDKDAVRIRGVNPVFYSIHSLPEQVALYLFQKALDDNSEKQLQPKQLKQIVNVCGRVPKLLKVVAGFIRSEENVQQAYSAVLEESKNNWKGEIGNHMECYIFAYENLEETLKEIFLDICVFFQGWDWETLSNIVREADLKMLEKRALVTKDVKSMTVRVHDVLLAIGLDKKGERFRFTRASDFQKFLKKDNDQLEKIKGIWSSDDSNLLYIPAFKLDLMHRSLRVLILGKSTEVEGKCKEIFEELVIFRARDSDHPFDGSKLKEFKKLKIMISKDSLHDMKAARSKDSIFEIGSSSSPQKDSIFELGASSPRTLPAIPTEGDDAAAGVEIETVDVNLSELSNYVSQLLNFRKEKKMGNDPLKPRGPKYFLPDSKRFFKLEEFLSEGTNAVKGVIGGERKTFIGHFLEGMEMPHMVATGFLAQANVLERYESISTNKEACLSLLNEMNTLAEHVKQLHERPGLREGMKVSIREATTMIVEASLACSTQIDASKFSGFFSTTLGKKELAIFEKKLQEMDTHVRNQMDDLCLVDADSQPESHFAKYPKYAVATNISCNNYSTRVKGSMAEAAVVSALIGKFIPLVADKLSQHVSLIVNFKKDFESFCEQLRHFECLLTDAGKNRTSASVSNWLESLEDFVADAEYLVEECVAADNIFAQIILRPKMGSKIRGLKQRLEKIKKDAESLKLPAVVLDVNAHGQVRHADSFIKRPQRSYARLQESPIVGIDGDINVITEWILKKDNPPVIAVVGMGGQGKTLLLQHVFNSEVVHKRFDCQVWLAVSQKFAVTELLRDMVKQFERNERAKHLEGNDESLANRQNDKKGADQLDDRTLTNLSEEDLRAHIDKFLDKKSCLFAVDDVWDRDVWEKIGLPSRTQDKVVVTTRDETVAKHMRAGDQILHKNSLSEEHSWRLFCVHAFRDDPHQCPKAVERIAREIVNKCGGLPLAIKTIGAHMASLPSDIPNKWEDTLLHLNTCGMSDRVMPSLKFSYEALPRHLKPCFLYCSVYPRNTEIESDCLVHAWIAQGFVSVQLQEAYDVGCSYMEELIDRCLIKVSEVGWNGRVNSCKMHDLLHDLAVSEQTKSLIKPGGQLKSMPAEECRELRRISLMKNEISTIKKGIQYPRLRSLLLSDNRPLTSISPSCFDNMRYLCVLDLSRTSITSLPNSIGKLKLLKYLNLSKTGIEKLPNSLSGLPQLQFLDVSGTNVKRLHSGIEKQKHMLHLNLGRRIKYCPVGISKLIYLQTLNGVTFTLGKSRSASALQLRDLKGLTLLQHLSIVFTSNSDDVRVEDEGTFWGMTKMRTLHVRCDYPTTLHLPTDMEAMQRLEIVHLVNCVVPKWIFQLHNLMELSLAGPSESSSADFRGLENIPNLKKLHLHWNMNPDFIEFPNEFGEAGAFPKLEELVIQDFEHLNSIPSFQEDAMPKLKCLRILGKPLENMPEGLMKLRNLKEVEVRMAVHDVEGFEYTKSHCWQSFKDRGIKIKVEPWDGGNELRVV